MWPSAAYAFNESAEARTNGPGVDITFTRSQDGSATGHQSSSGTSSCDWHATPFESTSPVGDSLPAAFYGNPPGDGYTLYVIWCGNQ